jgi:hypothetical protein
MSAKIKGALIGVMIFGSSSVALAREAATSHVPGRACSTIQSACLPWQAPVGHRQPEETDNWQGSTIAFRSGTADFG